LNWPVESVCVTIAAEPDPCVMSCSCTAAALTGSEGLLKYETWPATPTTAVAVADGAEVGVGWGVGVQVGVVVAVHVGAVVAVRVGVRLGVAVGVQVRVKVRVTVCVGVAVEAGV
jgi:hypothetical protein